MRLIDLLVMQGDDLGLFSSLFLVDVGSLYGGVHVSHVHAYLVVLSQHLEHLTMEGACVGMLHYNKIKEFIGEKGSEKEPRTLISSMREDVLTILQ